MQVTHLENEVLEKLVAESKTNGHSFGLLELVEWADRKQLGGVVTSLQNKGFITDLEKVETDQVWTQYVLSEKIIAWVENVNPNL